MYVIEFVLQNLSIYIDLGLCDICACIFKSLCLSQRILVFRVLSFFKSLCKQRLIVLPRVLSFFSYYYFHSYSYSRQILCEHLLLMIQICHLAHIFI